MSRRSNSESIHVVERLLAGKDGNPDGGEDRIVVTPAFAAVIDGGTGKTDQLYAGRSPGAFAADAVVSVLESLPAEASLNAAVEAFSAGIREGYRRLNLLDQAREHPATRASAVAAVYTRYRHEVWLIGDCQCMLEEVRYGNDKAIDEVLAGTRSLVLALELSRGATVDELRKRDPGRAFIHPLLVDQARFANDTSSRFGYAVLDGFPAAESLMRLVPLGDAQSLVLASDGYPVLRPTLSETEEELSSLLRNDPLCFRAFQSTKGVAPGAQSFDDRAYLKLHIG